MAKIFGIKAEYLLVIAIVAAFLWMNPNVLSVGGTTTGGTGGTCNLGGGTYSFDVSPVDRLSQGTAPSTTYTLYYGKDANGNYIPQAGTKTAGTPLTNLQPQKPYQLLAASSGYAHTFIQGTSACAAGVDPQAIQMSKNGGLSVTALNGPSYITQNGLTTGNLSVTTGGQATVKFTTQGNVSKTAFGSPALNYWIVTVTPSNNDWDFSQFKMDGCSSVSIPTFANNAKLALKCDGAVTKTQDGGVYDQYMTVFAKTATDPAAGTTLTLNWYPADYYVNTLTNAIESGVADNTGTELTVSGSNPAQYVVTIA